MRLVAVVPVRAGSKGMAGKNVARLQGVPLWQRAAEQGLAAGADEVLVSTDITDILEGDLPQGVRAVPRPDDLAGDDVPMAPVLTHLLSGALSGAARIVLLQATSPMRHLDDIRAAVALHKAGGYDLVKTVTRADSGVLKYGMMDGDRFVPVSDPAYCFTNRQALPPVLKPNGAVYVFDRDWYLANGSLATDKIGAIVMPEDRSFDIDTAADFARAEAILAQGS